MKKEKREREREVTKSPYNAKYHIWMKVQREIAERERERERERETARANGCKSIYACKVNWIVFLYRKYIALLRLKREK